MFYTNRFFLIIFFITNILYSQKIDVSIAPGIDLNRTEIKEIYNLWEQYLNNNPELNNDNIYWNDFEKTKYNSCDLLRTEGFFNPSLYNLGFKNIVLNIIDEGNKYLIKSMYYFIDENNNFLPFAETKVYSMKIDNHYKLFNYLPFATENWVKKSVGKINYFYPKEYVFDEDKANLANKFILNLEAQFELEIDSMNYYISPNCETIYDIKGFDFVVCRGGKTNLCGFFDDKNNIIYSNFKAGEFYKHELIHIVNKKYPKTNQILLSGLSVYTNSDMTHLGKSFVYHINNIYESILIKDSNFDFLNFDNLKTVNSETEVNYFVGALLIEIAIEKGGVKKLIQLFEESRTDDDIFAFFSNNYGLKKSELKIMI